VAGETRIGTLDEEISPLEEETETGTIGEDNTLLEEVTRTETFGVESTASVEGTGTGTGVCIMGEEETLGYEEIETRIFGKEGPWVAVM
jgi:hypothetical protein